MRYGGRNNNKSQTPHWRGHHLQDPVSPTSRRGAAGQVHHQPSGGILLRPQQYLELLARPGGVGEGECTAVELRSGIIPSGGSSTKGPRRSTYRRKVVTFGVDVAECGRMEEAEADPDGEEGKEEDPVFGRFDCNDNTPVLVPRSEPVTGQQQSPTRNEMSPTKSVTASPIRCGSRASSTSDNHPINQSLNGILYSPEDALNNDFFYDDEFSVPFDANLGENETHVVDVDMLDSMDINALLTLSRVYDDNQEPMLSRLVASKSDTCLYHQMSSSGDMPVDVETSGDQSMSDQCASSAELSELRSEPLFSPPPNFQQPATLHQYSTDSLGRDEPLSGSFTMGEEARYTYDCSANKGQYILSFDSRGHRHQSDDDSSLSNHDSIPSSHMTSSLTSWAQKSRDSNNFVLWGSRDSLGRGALSSGGSTPARGSPKHHPRYKQADQPLTTWSKVKEDKTEPETSQKEKLTTWRSLRETQSEETKEDTGRSKSLPDMRTKMKTSTTGTQVSQEGLSPRDGAEENLVDVDVDVEDECVNKRSTTSLFELFQRLRSQEEMGENMVSSATMHMLTGTWSMSPVSSEQSAPLSERSPSVPCLASWTTMKDLASRNASLRTSTADSIDSSTPDKVDIVSPANSLHRSSSCQTKLFTSFACNTSYHETPSSDAQCGSLILTQSLIFGKDNKDFCGQFPPNARDSSVQTSFEYGVPLKSMMNRSLQTSLGSSTESNKGDLGSPRYQSTPQQTSKESSKLHTFRDLAIKRQDTTPKTPSPVDPAVEPLKKSEPSLTSSLLFSNSALPDLSFLNKGMTQSISSFLEQASKTQPIFNPRMVRADTHTGHVDMSIGREALSREKKKRASKKSTPPSSRENSPGMRNIRRHNNDSSSSTSVCSTSSSGIDSGCYESSQSHSPRGNVQYFSDLGLFSPSISDSSTLSESSGSSPSNSGAELFSMPKLGEQKKGATKVQDPSMNRVKEVTSFAELATKQGKAVTKKLERQPKVETRSTDTSPYRGMNLDIPNFRSKGDQVEMAQINNVKNTASPSKISKKDTVKGSSPKRKQQNSSENKVMPPPKPPRLICEDCQSQHNEMISSVPVYSEPIYKMVAQPVKQVEYLQVSPTHRPHHFIGIPMGSSPQHQRNHRSQHGSDCMCCGHGLQKKPLKSCLVKRRRVRKNLFKHRSYSDSHDLAIMKYSQDGQTRYQLIAPSSCEQECVHGLSTGAAGFTSLPAEVLQESLREQVKKRLSQQDLPVLPLASSPQEDDQTTSDQRMKPTPTAAVANSPDLIPVMPCPCHGGSTSISSHSSDDSCSDCTEANRHKRSVSFSEEVFYHSPYNTPRGSPKKPRAPALGSQGRAASHPAATTTHQPVPASQSKPVPVRGQHGETTDQTDTVSEAGSDDTPPCHFTVSPSTSPTPGVTRSLSTYTATGIDLTHKKELVLEVIKAAEHVLAHFAKTRDPTHKMRLGSTAQTPEIGHLILKHLCPAIHAVLLDGLKPHVRSLFGRMRNSVWKVVEDSAELGPSTRVIHELVRDLKNLDFLSTNWLKVNAFIFGLLNHKALDFWLTYVHNQESLLSRHYTPESFLYLSATAGRALFLDMTTALQPLGQLPLRLEYQLEYQALQQLEQKRLSDYLLDKHVANAEHAYVESQQALANAANMNNANTKAAAQSQMAIAQALGQQKQIQQGLLHVGTKRLLGKIHQRGSLIESLSSVLPLSTNTSTPTGPKRTMSPSSSSPALASTSNRLEAEMSPAVSPADSDSVPVVWNNIVLDSTLEDSPEEQEEGLLSKLTRQVKQLASPEKQVYKRGVTEYQFDETALSASKPVPITATTVKSSPTPMVPPTTTMTTMSGPPKPVRKISREPQSPSSPTTDSDDDMPPSLITNSNTDSGIDQVMMEVPPTEFDVMPRAEMPRNTDPRKRWSDTAARWMGMDSGHRVEVGLTEVKKRWSSFGSNMLKMFDKLLLDDPAAKVESPPWHEAPASPERPARVETTVTSQAAPAAGVDWAQCETLVDLEQVLRDAPAGVQMWDVHDNTTPQQQEKQEPVVKLRRPQEPVKMQTVTAQEDRYVEALCALVSMTPDQLSFKQGQRMKVIRRVEDDLLLCRSGDLQGLVHAACVKDVATAEYTE